MYLKKSLGQHLLINEQILEKIVGVLAPTKRDAVVEIGPGTGNLTKLLAKYAGQVLAIEKDAEMIKRLEENLSNLKNIKIIHADFLKIDLTSKPINLPTSKPNNLFCGNIPYNISTPILLKLRAERGLFRGGVLTVQREVAKKLAAKPKESPYGLLSVLMQSVANILKCFDILPGSFTPPPRVTSTVVKIDFIDNSIYDAKDETLFTRIVTGAFQGRRKTIKNAIPKGALHALEAAGIGPSKRPEELSVDDFVRLTLCLSRAQDC